MCHSICAKKRLKYTSWEYFSYNLFLYRDFLGKLTSQSVLRPKSSLQIIKHEKHNRMPSTPNESTKETK